MSHFTVLVVGENIEDQLQPFHEFECTGMNDQYVQEIDVTEDVKKNGLDYYGMDDKTVTSEGQVDRNGAHKYGYALVDADGNVLKAVDRTNPNHKWDWWVVGGRWRGSLKLKDGTRADSAKIGDVDIEGLRDDAEKRARKIYAIYREELSNAGIDPDTRFATWEEARTDPRFEGKIDEARSWHNAQPHIKAIHAASKHHRNDETYPFDVFTNFDEFQCSLEEYVERERAGAFLHFAYVKDSKWVERGKMGWWAVVTDEKDPLAWEKEFSAMIESLTPETIVTVVDCHI